MKVAYLFTSYRDPSLKRVKAGEEHGVNFWGMFSLPHFGIEATYLEPEQFYPRSVSEWIRRTFGVYWQHLSILFAFFKYDLIFTSTGFGTQLVWTLLHFKKPKWVMHDFSIIGLIGEEKTLRQKLFAYITSRAAGIVTLGVEEKEKLEKRFPHLVGKIEFIPFGVDLTFFKPLDLERDGKIFAVGFDPDRDWKTFFDAVQDLPGEVVVATRTNRVEKLVIPPNVTIAQFTPRELAKEYAKSAIIVVPLDSSKAINDAMGCSTLFEAMASGRPVIATNTPIMASYVEEGQNGLLVPEGDSLALKTAIEALLKDEELQAKLGANARAYAEANLDAEKLAGKLAAFFKYL
ncbi:MAG: glycosyltransferase family 4 protein [Patescibacteria group bacterium]